MTESRVPVTTLEFEISFLQGSFTVLVKLSFWWTVPPLLRFDVCLTSFLFLFCISFCCLYYILCLLFCQYFFIKKYIFIKQKLKKIQLCMLLYRIESLISFIFLIFSVASHYSRTKACAWPFSVT